MKKVFCLLLVSFFYQFSFAQNDTLPKFNTKKKAGVIAVSWINAFKNVSQINIQRSKDSNRNFSTVYSIPNPNSKTYTYIDKTAKNDSGYYRIFVLFEGSNYIFTKSKKATEDTMKIVEISNTSAVTKIKTETKRDDKIAPPPPQPVKKAWEPSIYIFTGDDGNVVINLPEAVSKNYSATISKEDGRPVFVMQKISEPYLTLDKATFLKSGWYYFELKEDGKVKERNKFLITRDN